MSVRLPSARPLRRTALSLTALAVTAGAALVAPAGPAFASTGAGSANLPSERTMAWHHRGDWISQGTTRSDEPTSPSPCLTRPLNDYRGARSSTSERSFALEGSDRDTALAVVVQFDNVTHATAAERAVRRALQACDDTLADDASYVGTAHPTPARRVDTERGTARFTEVDYVTLTDADEQVGTFEAVGTVRTGRRLLVVSMAVHGQDNNWSYVADDPTGLPLHPMYRTLPRAANRLAR